MLEAARMLTHTGERPERTIRFWVGAEEQLSEVRACMWSGTPMRRIGRGWW